MDAETSRLKKPKGRTLAEFRPLNAAEEDLLKCAAEGRLARFGDERPKGALDANDSNRVRAAFIRFLALGGDDDAPVHERGLHISGACVEGHLDLESCETRGSLHLLNSRFDYRPNLIDARIGGSLGFSGSALPGLDGDRLVCEGSLFLRGKFRATGVVRLVGAEIRSNVDCEDGAFLNAKSPCGALAADGAKVKGDLRLGSGFEAAGMVRFIGATVGGDLLCAGGTFRNEGGQALVADRMTVGGDVNLGDKFVACGTVQLVGATIAGTLSCRGGTFERPGGTALDLDAVEVRRALMLDGITSFVGALDLTAAHAVRLTDDEQSWPDTIRLNGFRYDAIAGSSSPLTARARLAWLERQPDADRGRGGDGETFRAQPWLQLRDVLRRMGHYEAAREVGIAFERRKRACGLVGRMPEMSLRALLRVGGRWVYGGAGRLLHMGYGGLVGYGYRPLRLLMITALVWAVCGGVYFAAAQWDGAFVPTAQVLFSRHGAECGLPAHTRWTACTAIERAYPHFYPAVYSLNVLLPVGKLGQQAAWQPETESWGGWLAQMAVWFETLFGWVASLVLVAVVSGLAKHDE